MIANRCYTAAGLVKKSVEMRLGEALQIIAQTAGERKMSVHLLCGFVPLHLRTFIKAYLALRFTGASINVRTGLYGDLEGNIQRARENGGDGAIAVIEWSDLDQRLGFRAFRPVTRWEYHIENFFGMVHLACLELLLRHL